MTTFVALLRGINLGAVNKVPMKELRAEFEALGHGNVRTHLQSGNVVFDSSSGAKKLASDIEKTISKTFGVKAPVMLRTRREMERVAGGNPFATEGLKPTSLHVMFLDARPSSRSIAFLDPGRSPPDEFEVVGKEIYLLFPDGSGRSKLTIDYFENRLGTRATGRNWNTVTKVLELMQRS